MSTWLTPHAHARLTGELTALRAEEAVASDDDFARQRHRRARIRELEDVLRVAVVGEDPPDDGVAEPGMVLTVRYEDGDTETFLLAAPAEAVPGGPAVYSPGSPIGQAVQGAKPGEQRSYRVPSGATVTVTVLAAEPYGRYLGTPSGRR